MRKRQGVEVLESLEETLALYQAEVALPPTKKISRFFSELLVELANTNTEQEITNYGL